MMFFYGLVGVTVVMSLASFVFMGRDKRLAKHKAWRIPESSLLGAAFLFGGPGAWLGMKVFHHKTKHLKFQILVPLFTILQIVLLAIVYIKFT